MSRLHSDLVRRLQMVKIGWRLRSVRSLIFGLVLTSGVLIAKFSEAATYYVAKTGSNSNTCTQAQSLATPKLTIVSGVTCLAPGDTLHIRAGTYAEFISTIPGGTSWSAPVTVAGYPEETVTLTPSGSNPIVHFGGQGFAQRYIILDNLVLDGLAGYTMGNPASTGAHGVFIDGVFSRADHIRVQNSEIKRTRLSGIFTGTSPTDPLAGAFNEFKNLQVHHCGNSANLPGSAAIPQGYYINSASNVVEHNDVYANASGGIYVFNSVRIEANNNIIRYNRSHNNVRESGILLSTGANNIAYNNLVYDNGYAGIAVDYNASNAKVYNNTVYGNAVRGISLGGSTSNALVRNNIVFNNPTNTADNGGTGNVFSNNLTSNPSFVDVTNKDFRLQAGSQAVNAGMTISAVTNDYAGTPRPQGSSYDIGAYEYSANLAAPAPTAPTNLQVTANQ
jgi:parallel beta-helix repeat protein